MKKLQKRVRMNICKMSDMKLIQGLKKLERIEKGLKVYYEIC